MRRVRRGSSLPKWTGCRRADNPWGERLRLFGVRALATVAVAGLAAVTFSSAPVSGQTWSVAGRVGLAVPNGDLDPIRDTGLAIQIGATYMLLPLVGVGADIGASFMPDDNRPSDGGSLSTRGSLRVVDLSAHIMLVRPTGSFRPFAKISGGWYHLQALGQRTTTVIRPWVSAAVWVFGCCIHAASGRSSP